MPRRNSKISWTQVETGSAITWEIPELRPQGRELDRRILFRRRREQLPAGGHRHQMIHIGRNTKSIHRLEGIPPATPRTLPRPSEILRAPPVRAISPCDSLLMGPKCARTLFPTWKSGIRRPRSSMRRAPRRSAKPVVLLIARGHLGGRRVNMIVSGFCSGVQELPMEFAVEARNC